MDPAIENMLQTYGVTTETAAFLRDTQRMYINGEFVGIDERIDVTEPATASYLTSVPSASNSDVDRAVRAARNALDNGP